MRRYGCLAIAILVLGACNPGISAGRHWRISAGTQPVAVHGECAVGVDYADCLTAERDAMRRKCEVATDSTGCFAAAQAIVRSDCAETHVVFSRYADCVAIGENQLGPEWTF
jgi:hypothetical protein